MRARYVCECACEYLCECQCACARVRVQDANSAQGQHSDAQAHRHTRMRTRAYARARPRARVQTQALTGTLRGACLRGICQSERAPLAMSPCEEPMRRGPARAVNPLSHHSRPTYDASYAGTCMHESGLAWQDTIHATCVHESKNATRCAFARRFLPDLALRGMCVLSCTVRARSMCTWLCPSWGKPRVVAQAKKPEPF